MGEPEQEDSPCPEEGLCNFHRRKQAPRRRYYHTGWARTGLEPVVVIHINEAPFDALVDMSANYSMIDSQLCRYLHLDLTPFQYDVPLCTGIEGACMTKSIVAILRWVELEIGILGSGLATVRFWVADTMSCKGTPFILGGNQIKKIIKHLDSEEVDQWPQPWRSMHHRYYYGDHWCDTDSDDLYDSETYDTEYEEEDSFEALCRFECQVTPDESVCSVETWLKLEYPTPPEELDNPTGNSSVRETGIPGPVAEPDENGGSTPAAQVEFSLPRIAEQFQDNGGGEASVFTNLVQEPEGLAAEAELPACNLRALTPTALPTVKSWQYPTVSCRIAPDGATTFSLQWANT